VFFLILENRLQIAVEGCSPLANQGIGPFHVPVLDHFLETLDLRLGFLQIRRVQVIQGVPDGVRFGLGALAIGIQQPRVSGGHEAPNSNFPIEEGHQQGLLGPMAAEGPDLGLGLLGNLGFHVEPKSIPREGKDQGDTHKAQVEKGSKGLGISFLV